MMRKIFSALAIVIAAYLCALTPAQAEDDASAKEYRVKAAFLYNFTKFVEWPGAYALGKTHAANICIIGDDPFGSALEVFKQASSPQLELIVKRDIPESAIPTCNILFISRSEENRMGESIAKARAYPVLTVSEISGFADSGGIIEMVKVEKNIGLFSKDKINLRINLKAAEKEKLSIDARLLEIAAEVIK